MLVPAYWYVPAVKVPLRRDQQAPLNHTNTVRHSMSIGLLARSGVPGDIRCWVLSSLCVRWRCTRHPMFTPCSTIPRGRLGSWLDRRRLRGVRLS